MNKICNRCKLDLPLSAYQKDKNGPGGRNRSCGSCIKIYNLKREEVDPSLRTARLEYGKDFYKHNVEACSLSNAEYYKENAEQVKRVCNNYYQANKEKILAKARAKYKLKKKGEKDA